jgi:hypothetical protein
MDLDSPKLKFEPLTINNYAKWKKNMDSFLMEQGLIGYINGDLMNLMDLIVKSDKGEKAFIDSISADHLFEYKMGMFKVNGLIYQHCSPFFQEFVSRYSDPKDAYDALLDYFRQIARRNIVYKVSEISESKLEKFASVDEFLYAMKSFAEEAEIFDLDEIRVTVPLVTLCNLPFDRFRNLIEETLKDTTNLTFKKIEDALALQQYGLKYFPVSHPNDFISSRSRSNSSSHKRKSSHNLRDSEE